MRRARHLLHARCSVMQAATLHGRAPEPPDRPPADGPWRAELTDVVRAASGGLLFGVPLLYTMEVWWTGSHTTGPQMAGLLLLLLGPVFVLNQSAGFRADRDVRARDALMDTVEAVAIGICVALIVLVLLREVTVHTPLRLALGEVLYEAVPFCLGIGVARHFLQGGRDGSLDEGGVDGEGGSGRHRPHRASLADVGATTIGASFIALSIAPTDEVPMLTSAMSPEWLLLLIAASLAVSYAIVFVAGFSGQDDRHAQPGLLQHPATETVVSYLIAVVVAVALLWFFQRGLRPWQDLVGRVVVLAFPAAVGGAAGRLAV